jgi:hypothetical protein
MDKLDCSGGKAPDFYSVDARFEWAIGYIE